MGNFINNINTRITMKKTVFFLLFLLAAGCAKKAAEEISCAKDFTCPLGSTCFSSYNCPRGFENCPPPTGDLLCHKNCESGSDCYSSMPHCKQFDLEHGDTIETVKLCSK